MSDKLTRYLRQRRKPLTVVTETVVENIKEETFQKMESAIIDENGDLILTFSDGVEFNVGNVVGKDGINGKDGKDGRDGIDGKDGINGKDGKDGRDGKNGVIGIQGIPGPRGLQGEKGDRGPKGERGLRGEKGEQGEQGPRGVQGRQGLEGMPGRQGKQGPAGKDGRDGKDGQLKVVHDIMKDFYQYDKLRKRLRFRNPDGSWGEWIKIRSGGGGGSGNTIDGLTEVYHDTTLSGKGTFTDPLSVIGGGTGYEYHRIKVASGETYTIPADFQFIHQGIFTVLGTLVIIGEFAIV